MGDLDIRLKFKKGDDDDWTKVEDKALRKKIQNRLAKRKSRRVDVKSSKPLRQEIELHSPPGTEGSGTSTSSDDGSPPSGHESASLIPNRKAFDRVPASVAMENAVRLVKSAKNTDELEESLRTYLSLPGLTEHQFMPLMQYSLLRALVQNAKMIGLDLFVVVDDDSLSPWTNESTLPLPVGPHTLTPTSLQLGTPHHPYLDVLAPPSLRDNILLAKLDDDQEETLCVAMHTGSFTVWGSQPWNAMAWEASQVFVDEHGWLLDSEIIRTSNFWRAERGEDPLTLPIWQTEMLEEIA